MGNERCNIVSFCGADNTSIECFIPVYILDANTPRGAQRRQYVSCACQWVPLYAIVAQTDKRQKLGQIVPAKGKQRSSHATKPKHAQRLITTVGDDEGGQSAPVRILLAKELEKKRPRAEIFFAVTQFLIFWPYLIGPQKSVALILCYMRVIIPPNYILAYS